MNRQNDAVESEADPGFFLGEGAPLRNGVTVPPPAGPGMTL